jgi:peptidoglycan/LPS O-acetylase OafA/YrhL
MSSKTEIPALTGLRGLACILVVFAHFYSPMRVTPEIPSWMAVVFSTPGIGMAIFFTLSGYVIALSYSHWDWGDRPVFNLVRLFFYRFARLYPAFLLFAVLVMFRTPLLTRIEDGTADSWVSHMLLTYTWVPATYDGQETPADYFTVAWSLSVECGLYLAFGLAAILIVAAPPWRNKAVHLSLVYAVAAVLLLWGAWTFRANLKPDALTDEEWWRWLMFFSPFGISIQFVIGVAAYRLGRRPWPGTWLRIASIVGGLGLIAIYFLGIYGSINFAGIGNTMITTLVALATALIMIGSLAGGPVNRILSTRAAVYVGTISYSLYLFHMFVPILTSYERFTAFGAVAAIHHAISFAFAILVAIILATGVYHLVEVPGRRVIRAAADRMLGVRVLQPIGVPDGQR